MWLLIENINYHERWNTSLLFYLSENPDILPPPKSGLTMEEFFTSRGITLDKFLDIFPNSIVKITYGDGPSAETFPKKGEKIVWGNVSLIESLDASQCLVSLVDMPTKISYRGNNICREEYYSPDQEGMLEVSFIDADGYTDCPHCKKSLPQFEVISPFASQCFCPACGKIFVAKIDPWRHFD